MWTTPVDRRANVAMSSLVARSRDASRETRKLIERSRELIAVSRRLLNPAWRVSGASDAELSPAAAADPVALRLVIRRRLREDTPLARSQPYPSGGGPRAILRGVRPGDQHT